MTTALYHNSDTDIARWHIDRCQIVGEKYTDLDAFLNSQHANKFAFLHTPVFTDITPFEQDIHRLADSCNLIILMTSEVHPETVAFLERTHRPNIISFICGTLNSDTPHRYWMDWFITSTRFYRTHNVLDQLHPYDVKPKTFDILLGKPKPHRNYIYLFASSYKDRVVMTYFKNNNTPLKQYGEENWIWESEGLELPDQDFSWTVTPIRYHGEHMSLSQVVPISIYNETAYSIVCETNFDNHYSFFTEKTV
jgi:hypothetical protein